MAEKQPRRFEVVRRTSVRVALDPKSVGYETFREFEPGATVTDGDYPAYMHVDGPDGLLAIGAWVEVV